MKPSTYERDLKEQIEKLKERLDAVEVEHEPDWAERTSDFLHKGKLLAIETVALVSLLGAGGHILKEEFSGSGHEGHDAEIAQVTKKEPSQGQDDKSAQIAKKAPSPESEPDFELIGQTLLKNEAVTRQVIGDAEFERLKAILHSLYTTEQERTHQRNLPCPCGSGKKFKHCHAKGKY